MTLNSTVLKYIVKLTLWHIYNAIYHEVPMSDQVHNSLISTKQGG